MDVKILLCNCRGQSPSFRDADMNTLPFTIESELDVSYVVVHPDLCGPGGWAILRDAMRSARPDTYLVIGACSPDAQHKVFRRLLRDTEFPASRLITVDIRGADSDEIVQRLRDVVRKRIVPAATPMD